MCSRELLKLIPAKRAMSLGPVFRRPLPTILRTAPPPGVAVVVGGVGVHQIVFCSSQFAGFLLRNRKV